MMPIHTNPTRQSRIARAPYNFVPLPSSVVTVDVNTIPEQDNYTGHTGWFECVLETRSPTYVRGMVALEDFEKTNPNREAKDIPAEEKEARAAFYATNPDHLVEGKPVPTIPGSSLRGMIRETV